MYTISRNDETIFANNRIYIWFNYIDENGEEKQRNVASARSIWWAKRKIKSLKKEDRKIELFNLKGK